MRTANPRSSYVGIRGAPIGLLHSPVYLPYAWGLSIQLKGTAMKLPKLLITLMFALSSGIAGLSNAACYYSTPIMAERGSISGQWELGTQFPMLPNFTNEEGYQLFCYGPELEFIKAHFIGVPMHDGKFLIWHNSTARFIIEGLMIQSRP